MSRLRVIDSAEAEERRARIARLVPHPVLDWFPLLDLLELTRLSFDIQVHGLRDPIAVHGDVLLDGRGRLRACEMAGVEPRFEEWPGREDEIAAWVISKNLHRRHLSTSQRAMIAARVVEAGVGIPTVAAARMLGVSRDTAQEGKVVLRSGDADLIARVDAGELAVSPAAAEVRARAELLQEARRILDEAEPTSDELREVLADQSPRVVRAAVRTVRRVNDAYYTPPSVARACLELVGPLPRGHRVLEPSVGGGAWAAELPSNLDLHAVDIDPEAAGLKFAGDNATVGDFLEADFEDLRFDLILGNPPFDEAEAHVRKALSLLDRYGSLYFLLKSSFAGPARLGLFEDDRLEPHDQWILCPRPSFTGDGTDNQEYSLFHWLHPDHTSRPPECSWVTRMLRWRR